MRDLIKKLEGRLADELPGNRAHIMMQPKAMSAGGVRFNHQSEPRKGAVLILLYEEAGVVKFPLIQRPVYQGVHSGQIALPGGRYEEQDKDLVDTALRETEEEIGVKASDIEIIGNLSEFMVTASNHLVLPVVGHIHYVPSFIPEAREVDEVVVAELQALLDGKLRKEKEIPVAGGYKLNSPYFDISGKVVWGATAMMLSEFAHILEELDYM